MGHVPNMSSTRTAKSPPCLPSPGRGGQARQVPSHGRQPAGALRIDPRTQRPPPRPDLAHSYDRNGAEPVVASEFERPARWVIPPAPSASGISASNTLRDRSTVARNSRLSAFRCRPGGDERRQRRRSRANPRLRRVIANDPRRSKIGPERNDVTASVTAISNGRCTHRPTPRRSGYLPVARSEPGAVAEFRFLATPTPWTAHPLDGAASSRPAIQARIADKGGPPAHNNDFPAAR